MKNCPSCGFKNDPTATECSKCGIVFKKWIAVKKAEEEAARAEAKAEEEAAKAEEEAIRDKGRAAKAENEKFEKLRMEWEAKKAITAKIVTSTDVLHRGGIERRLERIGRFLYILSSLCFLGGIILGVALASPIWFAIGLIAVIQGLIVDAIFMGGADIIRLLKKLNGLPYGGRMIRVDPERIRKECSECEYVISDPDTKFCPQCGRIFMG